MATQLPEQQRVAAIAEANRRAIANGTSVTAELSKYADSVGLSKSDAEVMMGYPVGTLGGTPAAAPTAKAPNQWDTLIGSIRTAAAGAAPSATMAANTSNLGFNGADYSPSPIAATPAAGDGGAVSAGDNRWSGDPTRNPNGSFTGANQVSPGQNTGFTGATGGNLGMGDSAYRRNPYLDQTARDVGSEMFNQWNRNVAPGLRSGAMATGGYGGSRQGVVEANSLNDMNRQYGQALTSMYGQDYTGFQNRGIQRQGQAQSYDLGLRNSDLGFASLDHNISNSNFNNQMTAANFGLGVQNQLNTNNATGVAAGTQINNAPWDYQKYLNSAGNQAGSGWNTSTTTKTGG